MAAHSIRSISSLEFAQMMQRVKPPVGWSETLAIANSGGPDSTCLIFLLNRYLEDQRARNTVDTYPNYLVSLTIDHDLQSDSAVMADHAARIAKQLDVQHITTKLPWGQGIYPPKPGPEEKIEERARDMRYTTLMESLIGLNANSLALGHHLDDQVETMLMRLGRGSSSFGLAGMKPCRRWGMGTQGNAHLHVHQVEKMRRWIVRPLLSVGKDRILATCEAHKLEYVNDPTNFQPQLTIRNAIRHVIRDGGSAGLTQQDFANFPSSIAGQLTDINVAAANGYGDAFNLASDINRLREVSSQMTANLADIDASVDNLIAKYRLPSPPGTFMISLLSLKHIDSQIIREAFLYRVVRFVSPEPWGSPKSELGRRKASVHRLVKHLWDFQHPQSQNNGSLCVGSGVWWRLVAIVKGRLRTDVRNVDVKNLAWIALRQPQPRSGHATKPDSLRLDVTNEIIRAREAWLNRNTIPQLEIVFDDRFLIRFQVQKLSKAILESLSDDGRIMIEPQQVWVFPQITHVHDGESVVIHTNIEQPTSPMEFHQDTKSDWITVHHIRPLSAI